MKQDRLHIVDRAADLLRYLKGKQIGTHAASAGYFIVLSVFPLLVLLLALLRYTGLQAQTLLQLIEVFLPEALMGAARRLILSTYQNTSGAVISLSALTGLWSASRGVYGLITGLNAICQVEESRSFLRIRLLSVFYTFLFLLMLVLTLLLQVFGTSLLQWLPVGNLTLLQFLWELIDWRFVLLLLLQTGLFSAMFMAFPNRPVRFRQAFPGALMASLGWLIFSDLYSIYVEHFNRYANIFGSVYGVALSMLWLYCCLFLLFFGGSLNRYLQEKRERTQ